MVIGGVALAAWSEPRHTDDVDLIVAWPKKQQSILKEALIAVGAKPTSTAMRVLFEKTWTRFATGGPKLDIHIASSAHDVEALQHRVSMKAEGQNVPVANAEDLLLYKLKAWREQDQVDVLRLLREVKDMDHAYIEAWLDRIAKREGCPMRDRWTDALARAKRT